MPRRFEPLPAPFPLAPRLVRVLGAIIHIAVLPVFDARQDLSLSSTVALQLIGDDHAGDILAAFEELAEELLGGCLIAAALDQNIQDMAVLINGPPEVVPCPIDGEEDFI